MPKDGEPIIFLGGAWKGLKAGNPQLPSDENNTYAFIKVGNFLSEFGNYIYLHFPNLQTEGQYDIGNSSGSTYLQNNLPYHSFLLYYNPGAVDAETYLSFENGGKIYYQ